MRTHTKLALLNSLRKKRNQTSSGFTLVEVLVVAGILAILFASLVPNLLAARSRAAASAVISEAVGIGRACQAVIASGVGSDTFPNPGITATTPITCVGGQLSATTFNSRSWQGIVNTGDNIRCLLTPISNGTGTADVTITAAADGTLTCAL